jgi:hypothetical protein
MAANEFIQFAPLLIFARKGGKIDGTGGVAVNV